MGFQRELEVIQRQPRWLIMAFCLASLGAVGVVDYFAPAEIVITVFYVLPLALGSWCLSRSFGLALAVAGAVTSLVCESLEAGAPGLFILFLNAAFDGAVFVSVVLLVAGLKTALEGEQRLRVVAEEALANVRQLSSLLPMCSACKKIRHEPDGSWDPFEVYLLKHSDTQLSHGVCPDCMARLYPEHAAKLREQKA